MRAPTALAEAVKATVLMCGLELHVPGFPQMLLRGPALLSGVSELLNEGTRATDHLALLSCARALPNGSGAVPSSSWNRGVEAQTLFSLLTFAWLWCASCLSWRPVARCPSFVDQTRALRKFTELAAPKPTPRMGLFAILQVSKDVENVDHVVIFECVCGGSQWLRRVL